MSSLVMRLVSVYFRFYFITLFSRVFFLSFDWMQLERTNDIYRILFQGYRFLFHSSVSAAIIRVQMSTPGCWLLDLSSRN